MSIVNTYNPVDPRTTIETQSPWIEESRQTTYMPVPPFALVSSPVRVLYLPDSVQCYPYFKVFMTPPREGRGSDLMNDDDEL